MKNPNLLLFALYNIATLSIGDVVVATEDVLVVDSDPIVDESCASFDVVVYDATSGGIVAAVAAARSGIANVALLCASWPACFDEGGRRIGGMSTNGLGQSDIASDPNVTIGGLAADFYIRNRLKYDITREQTSQNCRLPSNACERTYNLEAHVARNIFHEMLKENNVTIFYSAQVDRVVKNQTKLLSLVTSDGRCFDSKMFIDASYEGDLMARANVSYVVGRESNETYDETLAGISSGAKSNQFSLAIDPYNNEGELIRFVEVPDESTSKPGNGDHRVQSYNFRLCVTQKNDSIPFSKPDQYDADDWELLRRYVNACMNKTVCQLGYPSCNTAVVPNSKYDMNNCGGISSDFIGNSDKYPEASYEERRKIWLDHLNYQQGLLFTLQNDPNIPQTVRDEMNSWGLCKDEFEDNSLAPHWPPGLYVREARRMLGLNVFTQNSPIFVHTESIGLGHYNFDSHNTQRLACHNRTVCFNTSGPYNMTKNTAFIWNEGDVEIRPNLYSIPRWVSIPKPSEVINLLVVGALSASHIGISSLRMEPQFMIIGHAAGLTASIAIESNTSRVLDVKYSELRARLLSEGALL
eukprot:g6233.t1